MPSPPLSPLRGEARNISVEKDVYLRHLKMASPQHPTTMKNLPDDVVSEIFMRLLAKQLAQMRSVCKPWNALLSDSSFIKSHLNRSIQNNNNDEILMFLGGFILGERRPTPLTVRLSRSPNLELTNFIKPPVIPQCEYGSGFFIGSVNGLICFVYRSALHDFRLHIWNPSLSAELSLPPSSLPSDPRHFGFGFDPKTDDYKALWITDSDVGLQTEVYSMRDGSWKFISQKFPSHVERFAGRLQVCVDDHLLWFGFINSEGKPVLIIVGFDLGAETYIVMPLPDSIPDYDINKPSPVLGVLSGKVCVMSCVEDGECEVWVMDEFGVTDSWVKHHAFSQFSGNIKPCGFTSYGEFLFQVDKNDNRFGLYDPIAAKTKTFKIVLNGFVDGIVEYVDSLVWVAPPKCEISSCDISQLQIGN